MHHGDVVQPLGCDTCQRRKQSIGSQASVCGHRAATCSAACSAGRRHAFKDRLIGAAFEARSRWNPLTSRRMLQVKGVRPALPRGGDRVGGAADADTRSDVRDRNSRGLLRPTTSAEMEALVKTALDSHGGGAQSHSTRDVTDRPWWKRLVMGSGRRNGRVWYPAYVNPKEFERIFDKDNIRKYQRAKWEGRYYLGGNDCEYLIHPDKLGKKAQNAVVEMQER